MSQEITEQVKDFPMQWIFAQYERDSCGVIVQFADGAVRQLYEYSGDRPDVPGSGACRSGDREQ